jgi:hypothetical protein
MDLIENKKTNHWRSHQLGTSNGKHKELADIHYIDTLHIESGIVSNYRAW